MLFDSTVGYVYQGKTYCLDCTKAAIPTSVRIVISGKEQMEVDVAAWQLGADEAFDIEAWQVDEARYNGGESRAFCLPGVCLNGDDGPRIRIAEQCATCQSPLFDGLKREFVPARRESS